MTIKNTIKNYIGIVVLYILSWINAFKLKLGILKEKYGIIGFFQVDGLKLSRRMNSEDMIEALKEFDSFKPDDVIISTYPKTGTHFTMGIVYSIFEEKGLVALNSQHSHIAAMEMRAPAIMRIITGQKQAAGPLGHLETCKSPRIFVTHLPWDFLPPAVREKKVKVIFCIRNPKDTVCSFFPFIKKVKVVREDTPWKTFFTNFIEGNVVYGSYAQYMKTWYPHRNNENVLNLQFEDMKEDLEGNVKKIAEFLGVELTEEQIHKVTEANVFENKKKEVGKGHAIYRSGKSGGWRSQLTVEQNEIMDMYIKDRVGWNG
ncbi:SULT6B1 [Bugula neritina]|uniref:SULT6B1 n=1 Tax=Bugula neritina TaxID=10212 RepID=A0A7J7J501_BUGNE|nr:SULT6B1 [Bugula neritina]